MLKTLIFGKIGMIIKKINNKDEKAQSFCLFFSLKSNNFYSYQTNTYKAALSTNKMCINTEYNKYFVQKVLNCRVQSSLIL